MNTDKLRTGYTTGTCATAASQAAGIFLLQGLRPEYTEIELPSGESAKLKVEYYRKTGSGALAAVRKDAGDDPDITHGCIVEAEVSIPTPYQSDLQSPALVENVTNCGGKINNANFSVKFIAGEGVGTITRSGLQIPIGSAAINPVPRQMITRTLLQLQPANWHVKISVPGGEDLARKTFNPRLGISGGISIIGTSGIVRPFSHEALAETVRCSLRVAAAEEIATPILVAGHYGENAARAMYTGNREIISVSNSWDVALDTAKELGFRSLIIVGHPGKLAKFCAGYFDTHSKNSPPALEYVEQLADKLHIPHGRPSDIFSINTQNSGQTDSSSPATVEGFFQLLSRSSADKLSSALAQNIAAAATERSGIPVVLSLIDMSQKVLATAEYKN